MWGASGFHFVLKPRFFSSPFFFFHIVLCWRSSTVRPWESVEFLYYDHHYHSRLLLFFLLLRLGAAGWSHDIASRILTSSRQSHFLHDTFHTATPFLSSFTAAKREEEEEEQNTLMAFTSSPPRLHRWEIKGYLTFSNLPHRFLFLFIYFFQVLHSAIPTHFLVISSYTLPSLVALLNIVFIFVCVCVCVYLKAVNVSWR